jgi:hypothetical protein
MTCAEVPADRRNILVAAVAALVAAFVLVLTQLEV